MTDPVPLLNAIISHYDNALQQRTDSASQSNSKLQELQQRVHEMEFDSNLSPDIKSKELSTVRLQLKRTEDALENVSSDLERMNLSMIHKDLKIRELQNRIDLKNIKIISENAGSGMTFAEMDEMRQELEDKEKAMAQLDTLSKGDDVALQRQLIAAQKEKVHSVETEELRLQIAAYFDEIDLNLSGERDWRQKPV